jgi:glycosyltransferase involved in cell wall biosynthesis
MRKDLRLRSPVPASLLGYGTLFDVRILVDYRPALRARTGVGEYIHHLVRAYTAAYEDDGVVVFTSSWKDRPPPGLHQQIGARVVDRRIPNQLLNALWHRLEWPSAEALAGRCDVVHAAHPLLIPARYAAQVVTIHDLFFLTNPEQTSAEIRRDYPALAAAHARRAHAIVTSTRHGRQLVIDALGVAADRVYVCAPGAPRWQTLGRAANVPAEGYVLFLGTLEPRKNIGILLDSWNLLRERGVPGRLVLAGRATPEAEPWLRRIQLPPLSSSVTWRGYVNDTEREELYAGARAVVLPSLDEGFGLTALEAMSAGVPLVASNRGSLTEVVGGAGTLVDPTDVRGLAAAIERVLIDRGWAHDRANAGLARASTFTWAGAAATLRQAYRDAASRKAQADEAGRAHRH